MVARRWWWVVVAMALPAQGMAQVAPQKMAADAAFDEGKRLMSEAKFSEACARFAESQRLEPASSTLLWLGECLEKSGKLASSWSTYREAASLAARQGKADREKLARERVAAIEPRVPRLVLKAPATSGLAISLDGVALGSTLWGTPLPVDAGLHSIELSAPGKRKRVVEVRVLDQPAPQAFPLPPLDDEAAPTSSAPPVASSAPPVASAPASAAPPVESASTSVAPSKSALPTVGWVLGGVGLAVEIGGIALQLSARSKADDSRARNDPALYNDAKSRQTLAIATMSVGGALMLSGVALVLFSPSTASSTALRISPQLSPQGSGLWLGGRFLP